MGYKDKEKQREYQRRWVQKRRQDWLDENGPCVRCGSTEDLEVDHIDPDQKISHRIWSWSNSRRNEELEKCQVLCSDCHKKKTRAWHLSNGKHGTRTMYDNHGCRCDDCVAEASFQRQRRRQ